MQSDDTKVDRELLKKLRRKAELCRFCHSELKRKHTAFRNFKEITITLLALLLAALSGLFYRNILIGEYVLAAMFFIPLVVALIQALDHTIFHWTNKVALHQAAVSTWGSWIREANFLERRIDQYESVEAKEKIRGVDARYRNCMESTGQIPNRLFLKYKRKFRRHLLESQAVDVMQLADFGFWKHIWPGTKNKRSPE